MAEVLTESFCERCGTRYTFESTRSRARRLRGVKVLSRGLKNFVMSDDSSLDEALAAARSDTEREISSQQLDAFHKTFNFCMTCRQYTCANCWNVAEGTCLTCSPHLGREILPAPFPDLDPALGLTVEMAATDIAHGNGGAGGNGADGNGRPASVMDSEAWPNADLPEPDGDQHGSAPDLDEIDVAARMAALTAIGTSQTAPVEEPIEAPAVEAVEATAGIADIAEPVEVAAAAEIADTAERVEEAPTVAETPAELVATPTEAPPARQASIDDVGIVTAAQTTALLRRYRPGQSLDAEIEAYERERTVSEPVVAAEIEAEPVVAAARAADVIAQPTWQIVAPDAEPSRTGATPPPPAPSAIPAAAAAQPTEWPAQPEWPSHRPADDLPFLGRLARPSGGLEALWAESDREVALAVPTSGRPAPGGIQPCISCGLSLSATARFCRRCGSPQAR